MAANSASSCRFLNCSFNNSRLSSPFDDAPILFLASVSRRLISIVFWATCLWSSCESDQCLSRSKLSCRTVWSSFSRRFLFSSPICPSERGPSLRDVRASPALPSLLEVDLAATSLRDDLKSISCDCNKKWTANMRLGSKIDGWFFAVLLVVAWR